MCGLAQLESERFLARESRATGGRLRGEGCCGEKVSAIRSRHRAALSRSRLQVDRMVTAREAESSLRGVQLDGTRCRELRRQQGLTQERLAETSRGPEAISLATVKRAERGATIDLVSASALARLLKVELEELTLAPTRASESTGDEHDTTRELPRSVAIAVLPFEALTDSAETGAPADYFCDGLMDDLVCRLGGWWFPVISRASTARYRGRRVDPCDAAAQLDARYIVSGTLRQHSGRVRITVELTNAERKSVLWTGQVNGAGNDILDLQAEMSVALSSHLGGRILDDAATNALAAESGRDSDAWNTALRGAWHYYRNTPQDTGRAREYLTAALRQEPRLRCAYYWLCMTYQQELLHQWSRAPRQTLDQLVGCAREFRKRYPHDPYMHTAEAYAFVYSGQRDAAHFALEEAIGAEPNITPARALYGQVLAMENRPEQAISQLQTALALSPLDPRTHAFKTGLALSYFVAGRYEETIKWAQLAIADSEEFGLAHATLACGRAYLGDRDGAKRALEKMQRLASPESNQIMSLLMAATDPGLRERFLHGLELAGLQT